MSATSKTTDAAIELLNEILTERQVLLEQYTAAEMAYKAAETRYRQCDTAASYAREVVTQLKKLDTAVAT